MKSVTELKSEGEKLTTYRKLMGMKQKFVANLLDTEQGNYSRMERGLLNSGVRLEVLKAIFIGWRKAEIKRLTDKIKYLESL